MLSKGVANQSMLETLKKAMEGSFVSNVASELLNPALDYIGYITYKLLKFTEINVSFVFKYGICKWHVSSL